MGTAAYGTSGYWLAGTDGGVFAIGSCIPFYGSMAGHHLNAPIVGIASGRNHRGTGYWLVGADGGVFALGNVSYYGSMAGHHLNAPIVGIASTADGDGYWLVAADGGVFAFGDALYEGSAAGDLGRNIVGIAGMAQGSSGGPPPGFEGYWLTTATGAVYAFGDAGYEGSASSIELAAPIVGIAPAQQVFTCSAIQNTTQGYWLVGRDGGVFSYGSATYEGSEAGSQLAAPIVGITSGYEAAPGCPAAP
ncbi:MAG: hypothetical protein ACYDD6_03830 [Acidimicrobiales bacterium]